MDLLEIRKKAKEKKEAEEKALLEAGSSAQAPGEQAGEEPPSPKTKPRKKTVRKKPRPVSSKKPSKKAKSEKAEVGEQDASPAEAGASAEPAGAKPPEKPPGKTAKKPSGESGKRTKSKKKTAEEPPPAPVQEMSGPEEADILEEPWQHEGAFGEEEGAESEANVIEYLAFMLSDEEYAVKVEDVKEIIRLQRITRVPRAEDFVEGIISLRGVIIPVFDIKKRLGLEKSELQRSTRIVIVSEDGSPQGIIVDKVTGVARLYEDGIEPPPAVIGGVEAEYLEGVGRIDDRLLILFNTRKVLEMGGEDIG